jgi:hypothetical protein
MDHETKTIEGIDIAIVSLNSPDSAVSSLAVCVRADICGWILGRNRNTVLLFSPPRLLST